MKLKFRVAPHIKDKLSTQRVMRELTFALLAVLAFSMVYYAVEYDMNYVTHVVLLLIVAIVTSVVLEAAFAKVMKISFKKQMTTSFPWVTPLILVLIMPINTPIYVMIVSTAIAVFFGKLVYGGLGQNIFNPAGIGRAVIAVAFAGKVAEDLSTSATPIGSINSYGWLLANNSVETFLEQFGGWTGLATGWHAGSLGETPFLLIILLGVILIIREVIDWRVPVFYIGTVFLTALVVGLVGGVGIWYPVYHVLTGGVAFAAVFMLTDPVTNPTHPYGRVLFAVGTGILTVMLRVNSAMPGGVVFAILFMNMLSPSITRILEGNQIKKLKAARITLVVLLVLAVGLGYLSGTNMEAQKISTSPVELLSESTEGDIVTYELSSPGFAKTTPNVYEISIDTTTNTISSVVNTVFNDSVGIGEPGVSEDYLENFVGLSVEDEVAVDTVSGVTFTSAGTIDAVSYAMTLYLEGGQ